MSLFCVPVRKSWCFLSVFPCLIWFFVKIFPHFYNQIKHKADNRFYPPNKNKKPMEIQTNMKCCAVSGKSKLLCGLHKLGIREHSSRSVAFDMSEVCENFSEGAEIFLYLRQLLLINVILDMFFEVLINYFCFC